MVRVEVKFCEAGVGARVSCHDRLAPGLEGCGWDRLEGLAVVHHGGLQLLPARGETGKQFVMTET